MGWLDNFQTSIVLPSGGQQVAGSGTVVIGANAADGTLPQEIINSYGTQASAIIFYSTPNNAAKLVYYYILYNSATGFLGGIEVGYVPVGLGSTLSISQFLGEFGSGRGDIFVANDMSARSIVTDTTGFTGVPAQGDIIGVNEHLSQTLTVVGASILAAITATSLAATGAISGATVQSTTTQDLVNGAVTTKHHNNGTDSYLTDNSAHVDTIITINGSLILGGQTGAYVIKYVISYDRVCNISVRVTWTVATTVAGNQGIPGILPAAARPLITTSYQTGLWVNGTNVTGMSQFNYDGIGGIAFIAVPTGTTVLVASATYIAPKPTF